MKRFFTNYSRKLLNSYLGIAIPKTIFFNFRYFPFKTAIKFPVLIFHNVILMNTKGKLFLDFPLKETMRIRIGFGETAIFDKKRSKTIWNVNGTIVFKGSAIIGHGSKIDVDGELILGDRFRIQAESTIIVKKKIIFGNNCLISWDCQFMDTDFHSIISHNEIINPDTTINIGNNCWFGCRCLILKGTEIGNNSVVAAGTVLNKAINGNNHLIAGVPGMIVKSDISWKA